MFDRSKKDPSESAQEQAAGSQQRPESTPAPTRSAARTGSREAAVIGPSIHIDGDVRGDEDLIIKGQVNGTVRLAKNSVTIGSGGSIKADVHAQSIYVEGVVEGDLYATDRVGIRKDAKVHGNIMAPSVSLDEGARFKGSIEMDVEVVEDALGSSRGAAPRPVPAGSKGNGDSRLGKPQTATKSEPAKPGSAT